MSSARAATRIAIIVGAGVGALGALMSSAPRPAPEARPLLAPTLGETPPQPVETPEPERAARTAPTATSAVTSLPARTAIPSATAMAHENELDRTPIAELEKRCAFRQPQACSASARAFDRGLGAPRDAAKARLYRALAVSLLDERCLTRDAESCHDLAELYRIGAGVDRNPSTAEALGQRVRELCTGKTNSFCERLGTSTVPE